MSVFNEFNIFVSNVNMYIHMSMMNELNDNLSKLKKIYKSLSFTFMHQNVSKKNQFSKIYLNYIMFMFDKQDVLEYVKRNVELVIENTFNYQFYSVLTLKEVDAIEVNQNIKKINNYLNLNALVFYDSYKEGVFHAFSNYYPNLEDVKSCIEYYLYGKKIDFNVIDNKDNKDNNKNYKKIDTEEENFDIKIIC